MNTELTLPLLTFLTALFVLVVCQQAQPVHYIMVGIIFLCVWWKHSDSDPYNIRFAEDIPQWPEEEYDS